MIGSLQGAVASLFRETVILDVGGVGYRVHVKAAVLARAKPGDALRLFTHLSVREDALELFGFETSEELSFFVLLIGVSGIGPKSAIAIMNLAEVSELSGAIAKNDVSYLTRVSGIGKKTAEKIVLELRDKVGGGEGADGAGYTRADADVLDALTTLGYSVREAREALKRIPADVTDEGSRLREALRLLGTS
jgi:Holliday junction DNA helicase RuvA